jgi:hypothetical protein
VLIALPCWQHRHLPTCKPTHGQKQLPQRNAPEFPTLLCPAQRSHLTDAALHCVCNSPQGCQPAACAGHARIGDVLALLFDYLAVLRAPSGVSKGVWEENRALCAMRFDFSERLQPLQAAQSLAHSMHDYADRCWQLVAFSLRVSQVQVIPLKLMCLQV